MAEDITTLTALAAASSDDILYIVDAPGGTPIDRKITVLALQASTQGGVAYTWPATNGDPSQVLTTDGSGVLSWGAGGGSVALNDLTDVTITAAATGDILRYDGAAWVDYPDSNYAAAGHDHSGVYQPVDADLTAIAGLSSADGNFIVGSATGWVAESGATARTSLGVDAAGTDNSTNVSLAGTLDYITIVGQVITRGAIDLATDITLTSLAQFDILYGASATGLSRLGGNVAATNLFLRSVGTGAAAQAPSWEAVTKTDVGLSAVENTALSTWAGSTSIVTLGTITTGTFPYANLSGVPGTFAPAAHALESHSDVTITAKAAGDILRWNGSAWVDYADSAYATAGHDHSGVYQPLDADLTTIAGLAPPGADRILFWDHSALAYAYLAAGSGITITDTTITASASAPAFDDLTDVTLTTQALGDLVYASSGSAWVNLAGNTTATKKFLRQTGNGSISAAPAWDTVTATDVGLGNVENTALSTWAGSTAITTLGTIATGVWNATALTYAYGGTGQTTYAAGDIIYASSINTLSKLAATTDGYVLTLASGLPVWAAAGAGSGAWTHATTFTTLDNASDNVGIGVGASPSARLHIAAGTATAGSAPLKLTSGTLLTATEAGAIEFLTDEFYGTITSGAGASFTSEYPPAHSDTYVKATSYFSANYYPYFTTNPAKSLTGSQIDNTWLTSSTTNQRFHIDLGSAKVITRFYYENHHSSGANTVVGVNAFTIWGSNDSGAFSTLTYATDTNWTQITASQANLDQHSASDAADPKYITLTNSTAYRYYAFKFATNHGDANYMAIRRIELQTGATARKAFVLNDGTALVSGRVPYATTNGRLLDAATFVFDGTSLGVGTATPSAKIHALATTLQQRWGYDASTYLDLTIGSSGLASWSPTGAHMNLASGKNLLIGGTTAITTGTNSLGLFTGTAPSAVAADSIALYSSDLSAGNTVLSLWTEGTAITTAAGNVAMRVNGNVRYLHSNSADVAPGVEYGGIRVANGVTAQTGITTTPVLLTAFTTNAPASALITPDQANDNITVNHTGTYFITFGTAFSGTGNSVVQMHVRVDAAETDIGFIRKLGAGGDSGAAHCSGILALTTGAVVTIYVETDNAGAGDSVTVNHASLSVMEL